MTNRREFLQTSAVVSALAMNGFVPRGDAAGVDRASLRLHAAIYDNRYAESVRFAQTAEVYGVRSRSLDDGDVTSFWYDELDARWRTEPAAIAGCTQLGPLFVLEQLAHERGLHVVLRAEHRPERPGLIAHALSAPVDTVRLAGELAASSLDWPVLMGVLACRCPSDAAPEASAAIATPGTVPRLDIDDAALAAAASPIHYYTPRRVAEGHGPPLEGPLFSWVIAERRRA